MPFGLLTGLGAALAWGTMDIGSALAGRRLGSLAVTAGGQVVSAVLLFAMLGASGMSLPSDPRAIVVSAVVGIVGAGAYLAYFTGLRIGPIAVVSGMVAAYGGLTVLLAVIVRSETLTPLQAAGAIVATVGVVMTGVAFDADWRHTRLAGPGVAFAIVALILFAVMTVGLAEAIDTAAWLPVIALSRGVNAVLVSGLVAVAVVSRHRAFRPVLTASLPPNRRAWSFVVAGGVLDAAGLISISIGLESAPTWLVGLASSFGPAVTILAAVALLGERLKPVQWLGLAGIGIGLVAIALP
ncbi:MAG TPA: DMT family transporter, partial [Candidatus Bathyarchaeia archaeon]|jgi:drug/metabolite transporter (DMT)-like permease|nr:DMT family transporter [Candidatus Bathyarchaeia archaeon]